ncbi:SGNH/GDSL hydrolase family protein [Mangrovihabitans endophyticus]|uniref:Lipase 1 n=1 Tax=Mangrovihabitans endophyticus TaxID=1751298 RepID=A0A8J3FN47_9ACTN|nr:SGNH/GDSL hydrolase family protein [Mangrovihabitans endophyticus]GGK84376.1 lipase 1 [Mangrovihabitans endophyticus]
MNRRPAVLACLAITSLLTLVLTTAASPAQAASAFADTDYVALGDSYSSGVGAPGQSGLCLRSSRGYPAQWTAANDPRSFTNLTCGGAETDDVRSLQVPFMSSGTDLVSITIGGNDAGFAPTVISCTVGSDADCQRVVDDGRDYITDELPADLDATYAAIRRRAPHAHVVVLGYPVLFDTSSASCGIGGMSLTKRRALNDGARLLDDTIAARAQAAGFTFADVRDRFAGHGVCGPSPWINGLTLLPPTDSFHPNQSGYTYGYLPALSDAAG